MRPWKPHQHGLDQRRLDGVKLAAGAFTNLGRDHMDYHATIEEYLGAKMRLLQHAFAEGCASHHPSPTIISRRRPSGGDACWMRRRDGRTKRQFHCSQAGRARAFPPACRSAHRRWNFEIELPLAGDFQVANALVAAGLAMVTGVPAAAAMRALALLKGAPGRLDAVGATEDGAPAPMSITPISLRRWKMF